jgi:hypothetical protein
MILDMKSYTMYVCMERNEFDLNASNTSYGDGDDYGLIGDGDVDDYGFIGDSDGDA